MKPTRGPRRQDSSKGGPGRGAKTGTKKGGMEAKGGRAKKDGEKKDRKEGDRKDDKVSGRTQVL